MENLLVLGKLLGVLDIMIIEVCDMIVGGVFLVDVLWFDVCIDVGLFYIGVCGVFDMVNFGVLEIVFECYWDCVFYEYNL